MFNKAKWIEVAGFVAIVVSLIFVGMELRQNTAALSAQALLDLNLAVNEEFQAISTNESLAAIWVKSEEGVDNLTPVELYRLKSSWLGSINTLEAAYLFYRKGIISEFDYSTYYRAACDSIAAPGVKEFLESGELKLNPDFVKNLDKCVEKN